MKRQLRFRHIEGLQAILSSGTATGAAAMMNVTQPAITQLVKEAEEIVGYTLFDRRGGRLSPTNEARLLYEEIHRCYTGIEHINAFCDKLRKEKGHSLVLATVPSLALSILPKALASYHAQERGTYFKVLPRHSNDALEQVGSQKGDIGFGTREVRVPGITCSLVSSFPLLAVLPKGHPLGARDHVALEDFQGERFIRMSPSEGLNDAFTEMLEERGIELTPVGESPMATVGCALVESGIGVTAVDHCAAYLFLDRDVVIRPITPQIRSTYYAYWLTRNIRERVIDRFLGHMRKEAAQYELHLHEWLRKQASRPPCAINPPGGA